MHRQARKPLAPAARACVNCQKRKSRCLQGSEAGNCSFCEKTGKICSFEGPPSRTPLTRKNLDAAERRCTQLRALLRSLNPDLNIDSALESRAEAQIAQPQPLEEVNESTPDSYEWHEGSLSPEDKSSNWDDSMATDGMATLSTTDSGYLGSSSGSRLLEELDSSMTHMTRQRRQRKAQRRPYQTRLTPPEPPDLSMSYVASNLIDAYFHLYHIYYPVLHEKSFRDRVATGQQHRISHSPWRVNYYMVLAIGHWASSRESEHARSNYYTAARASLSLQMLESGVVETVQAFLLMGNYLQKRDRTNTGYNFVGLAYRMALGIGLHREPAGAKNTIGHERRRQLFWTIYCFESGFNITTGRPPTMADGFIDINLPRNIDDKDLPLSFSVPEEVHYPTTYSAIISQAKLAKIADAIYHEYLLAKTAGSRIEYRLAESLERDLSDWRNNLPSYFSATEVPSWWEGPRFVLHLKEQNLRILLWRGSQKYHAFLPTRFNAEEKCLDVAMESIHDIATFCMMHKVSLYQGLIWYTTYFLLQATLVVLVGFLGKSNHFESDQEPPQWHHSIFKARDCLRALAERSISAGRCLELLDRICSRFQSLPTLNSGLDPDAYLLLSLNNPEVPNPSVDAFPQDVSGFMDPLSENYLAFGDEGQPAVNDDTGDPNLRTFMNEVLLDFKGNMPLDLLFNDWVDYGDVPQRVADSTSMRNSFL
ncbi:transcriptional regulatory protein C1F7.11c [Penicillium argentinense]|uniref:Transcriptional regulatory protein C1F7.11c n=1 Tax=Penicillium argentinense TaxID=1131581 RepID=A0A9W9K3L3_9EURO|nr:transcriptional regulatory protein C1F7.11c [Penicillium argentinense]KAJ5090887.1 transcriptional regulatory protein C1F7.11c [Penicillium argentinense]